MTTRVSAFIDALAFARGYTGELLDVIPDADWFAMPPGCPSHVAWQVGHLAFAEARLVVERVGGRTEVGGGVLPAEFIAHFARNSIPDASPANHPTPAEIRRVLDRVHGAALQTLRDTRDEDLETLVPGTPHRFCRTKADFARWASHHEFLHAGQIGLIRRMLGKGPVW
jgi:DinB superfamily